ncbi:MAG: hypothetical protein M3N07_01690 [Pseudomonadota bacterium]|nr:hypothetical protein [Pseudomonadota bacterium]
MLQCNIRARTATFKENFVRCSTTDFLTASKALRRLVEKGLEAQLKGSNRLRHAALRKATSAPDARDEGGAGAG